MSARRLIPVIGLGGAALALVGACLPWSVTRPGLSDFVGRELTKTYGIAMAAEGSAEVALLPLPRLGFSGVRLSAGAADGPVLAEGANLSLQLSLPALLSGRVEVNALAMEGGTIVLSAEEGDGRWAGPLAKIAAGLSGDESAHPRRISINRATVVGHDPRDGTAQTVRDVDFTVSWPLWSASLDLAGGFTLRDGSARFAIAGLRPGDLIAGGNSPFAATASWPAGKLAIEGNGSVAEGLRLTGRGSIETTSLSETLAWTGGGVALSPFIEALALEGGFEARGRTLLMPALRVSADNNRLEGAGSITFEGVRPAIQATLASETLTIAPLLAGTLRLFGLDAPPEGDLGPELSLAPLTGGDLDLRISAGTARLGPVLLEDVAGGVLVRAGSIEASLGRASVKGATIKGRIGLAASAADAAVTEVKAQGAFDRLDLGALLIDLGQYGWVLGGAQGHFAVEGQGRRAGDLVRSVGGRANLSMDGGTLAGLNLAEVANRNAPVTRSLTRRAQRTDFERAAVTLRFAGGIGEIVEGSLKAQALTASLRGMVSLPARSFSARAELAPNGADTAQRAATLFEIGGPWDAVTVRAAGKDDPEPRAVDPMRPPQARGPAGLPPAMRAYAP
jgi:AsmA protein